MKIISFLYSILFFGFAAQAQEVDRSENRVDSDKLRVAVVNIQELCATYRKAIRTQQEIDLARAEIQKKNQLAVNEYERKKSTLEANLLRIRNSSASETEKAEMSGKYPALARQLQLENRRNATAKEGANSRLNQQMLRRMAGLVNEIVVLTARKAEEAGYDLVLDSSGMNSNQVLPVLFSKDAVDITEWIRKELNKSPNE